MHICVMFTRGTKIVLLLLALVPGLAFSAGDVEFFTATFNGSSVRLDWKLSARQQADFEVFRKRPEDASYMKLGDMPYNGTESYTMQDDNLYRGATDAQVAFSYKLVVHQGNSTQNYIANVENGPTAVQRSWGSIKLMFR